MLPRREKMEEAAAHEGLLLGRHSVVKHADEDDHLFVHLLHDDARNTARLRT